MIFTAPAISGKPTATASTASASSRTAATIGFVHDDYPAAAAPAPPRRASRAQRDAGLFTVPAGAGLDPVEPWRLELVVNAAGQLPAASCSRSNTSCRPRIILMPEAPPVAAWVEAWRDARVNIAILAVLLTVLTAIFVFQAQLSRSRRAHRLVRNGFLLVVLVWLGWTAGAQLSIVNVINYIEAPFRGFGIGFYLAEPLMVMIAAYTLVSLVLIGRGVFCGWLCPFGALQELLAQLSRALGLPQWNPPPALEKRLWLGKYIAAAVVLALALFSVDWVRRGHRDRALQDRDHLEIHPRLALCLLCRGAAGDRPVLRARLLPLPVSARRRAGVRSTGCISSICSSAVPNAASPCHLCERSCPVRAIEQSGKIITAECFQCLDCQVEYYDDKRCPPLVQAAKRRGGADADTTVPVAAMANHV